MRRHGAAARHGRWLTRETGIPAYLAEEPVACVAKGAAKALTMLERLRRALPSRLSFPLAESSRAAVGRSVSEFRQGSDGDDRALQVVRHLLQANDRIDVLDARRSPGR